MRLLDLLSSALHDASTNNASSMRLALLEWSTGVLIVWGVISFVERRLVEIPESVVVVLAGFVTGKVWQRLSGENKTVPPKD